MWQYDNANRPSMVHIFYRFSEFGETDSAFCKQIWTFLALSEMHPFKAMKANSVQKMVKVKENKLFPLSVWKAEA